MGDPRAVLRAVRIFARFASCSGSPTSTESLGRAWTMADVVGSDFPSAAPRPPVLLGRRAGIENQPPHPSLVARSRAGAQRSTICCSRCASVVQILVLHPSIPLTIHVPCLGKSWGLGHGTRAGGFSEHATGF